MDVFRHPHYMLRNYSVEAGCTLWQCHFCNCTYAYNWTISKMMSRNEPGGSWTASFKFAAN